MNKTQDCDLQLTLNEAFGAKLLNSIRFPWSIKYDLQPAYYPFDVFEQEQTDNDDASDAISDEVLAAPLQQQFTTASDDSDIQRPIDDLACDLDAADDDASERRYKIDVHSVSLVVPRKPSLKLGNPVTIDDLTVRVKARFKASIRVFGKEYSTIKTTPWVTLSGRSATLKLSAAGARVLGTLVLDDIDLVAKVKILKWHYNCQLGLTGIMNKQLAKRGAFELLDLSTFQRSLLPESDIIAVDSVDFDATATQLLVKLYVNSRASPTYDGDLSAERSDK